MTDTPLFERMADYCGDLQDRICAALESIDGVGRFRHDDWSRDPVDLDDAVARDEASLQGGGRTRVMEDGAVFEKAGVNLSVVHGLFSKAFAAQMPGDGRSFRATGISLVLHPRSPRVPTVHMNVRRIEHGADGWFGGGADLTPYYLVPEDAVSFHAAHRAACDAHPTVADYARFKAACDAYFHLPHRGEARGIGGIFFDELRDDPEETFAFVRDAGEAFLEAYLPIVRARRDEPYGEAERDWQLVRRGRYVEFNLMYDRGTIFGLKTGGRTESILMSLPHPATWRYRVEPAEGSAEADLLAVLREPREWLEAPAEAAS